jgi:hypothetical protein
LHSGSEQAAAAAPAARARGPLAGASRVLVVRVMPAIFPCGARPGALLRTAVGTGCAEAFAAVVDTVAGADVAATAACPVIAAPATAAMAAPAVSNARIFN